MHNRGSQWPAWWITPFVRFLFHLLLAIFLSAPVRPTTSAMGHFTLGRRVGYTIKVYILIYKVS